MASVTTATHSLGSLAGVVIRAPLKKTRISYNFKPVVVMLLAMESRH